MTRLPRLQAITALVLLAATGCAGHASIDLVPLGLKKISTTAPLVIRIKPTECYYWVNDKGKLCVAMRAARASLLGRRFDREFELSLVLGDPPAGSTRNYRADRHTLRSGRRVGFGHARFASLVGIVAVWDHDKARLRGRLRITAKAQSYSVLTGWSTNARVLLVGEFTAVHDHERGREILARTEEGGLARGADTAKPVRVTGPPRAARHRGQQSD